MPSTATPKRIGLTMGLAAFVATLACVSSPAIASQPAVSLNDPDASSPVEPAELGPGGQGLPDYVRGIKWASWGGAEATGEGKVQAHFGEVEPSSPVNVTLSGLVTCDGYPIYTRYELAVQPGALPGLRWSQWKSWQFPCRVAASNYQPSQPANKTGGCATFANTWVPAFRGAGFCRMQWAGFGTRPTTIGKGVVRNGLAQWGVEVVLSDIQWCPTGLEEDALSYTHVSMAIYGNPESLLFGHRHPVSPGGDPYNITVAEADHLRDRVGRPGFKKKEYRHVGSFVRGCKPIPSG
jgi:hypothetical protein